MATLDESLEHEPVASPVVPDIQVHAASQDAEPSSSAGDEVDRSIQYRVRTLYRYDAQRPEELSFTENLVLTAHPTKLGPEWWHGSLGGQSGFFPSTYVAELSHAKAKALYTYEAGGEDELPFAEGDVLDIVDHSEGDWWKTEQNGLIFIVPAAYLELSDG